MSQEKRLDQPRIADEYIERLSIIARQHGLEMTELLTLIITTAIEELEDNEKKIC